MHFKFKREKSWIWSWIKSTVLISTSLQRISSDGGSIFKESKGKMLAYVINELHTWILRWRPPGKAILYCFFFLVCFFSLHSTYLVPCPDMTDNGKTMYLEIEGRVPEVPWRSGDAEPDCRLDLIAIWPQRCDASCRSTTAKKGPRVKTFGMNFDKDSKTSAVIIGSTEALPVFCMRCARWERERERERERYRERERERERRKWRHFSNAEIGEEVCTFPCQNAEIGEEFCTFPYQKIAP